MRILLITYSLRGGAGKACYRLYEALKEHNPDVKILYLDGFTEISADIQPYFISKSKYYLNQLAGQIHIKVASILFKKGGLIYRKSFLHTWLKYHELFEWADVINLHWIGNTLDWKLFFRNVKKPIVWTLHDMLPFSGGYHYLSEVVESAGTLCAKVEKRKARYLSNAAITIVAPSQWILGVSRDHLPFNGAEHLHIFNCVPSDLFMPIERHVSRKILGLPLDKKIILFSADDAQSKRKGFENLVDAISNMQELNLFLLSMGKGLPGAGLSVPHKHLGKLNDEYTLSLAYSSADVVVVPSIEDNSPNIVIESFACGRPVVGFNVGGVQELINNEKLGVVVGSISASSLEAGLREALNKSYDTNFIRNNCLQRFNYDTIAEQYSRLFNKIFIGLT